jgi:DNA modification methylase
VISPGFYQGDAIALLRDCEDSAFQTCITSPPYWGLRRYGSNPGEIGCEQWSFQYLASLVLVFREVRRTLKKNGTLWLNVGDAYNAYNANRGPSQGLSKRRDDARVPGRDIPRGLTDASLPNKALMGMPWRLALALQQDGWVLRSEIIWHKMTAKPERTKDRPSREHEHIFLFTKHDRYKYHKDAVPEARRTVWLLPSRNDGPDHPARFPDELARRCLLLSCDPGDLALDPFAGSDTVGRIASALGIPSVRFDLQGAL